MRRREFVAALAGAAVIRLTARGQQSAMPTIGFLHSASPGEYAHLLAAFLQGLEREGYVEGQNIKIEYRWLPKLRSCRLRMPACSEKMSVFGSWPTTATNSGVDWPQGSSRRAAPNRNRGVVPFHRADVRLWARARELPRRAGTLAAQAGAHDRPWREDRAARRSGAFPWC